MDSDSTKPNDNSDQPDSDQAMSLDQNELDSLFSEFNFDGESEEAGATPEQEGQPENPPEPEIETETETDESSGTLDQSAIDALFQDTQPETESQSEEPPELEPDPEPEPEPEESSQTLDQSAIDALFQGSQPSEEAIDNTEGEPDLKPESGTSSDDDVPKTADSPQSETSQLPNRDFEPEEDQNSGAGVSSEEEMMSLGQDELDRLFQEYSPENEGGPETPPVPKELESTEAAPNESPNDAASATLDQGAIDQLFTDVDSGDSQPVISTPEPSDSDNIEDKSMADSSGEDNETPSPDAAATGDGGQPQVPPEEGLDLKALNSLFAELAYEEVVVDVEKPLPNDIGEAETVIKASLPESRPQPLSDQPVEPLPEAEPPPPSGPTDTPLSPLDAAHDEERPTLLEKPAPGRQRLIWIGITALILIAASAGGAWLYFTRKPQETLREPVAKSIPPQPSVTPKAPPPPPAEKPQTARSAPGSQSYIIEENVAAISELEKLLRTKRDEIETLRQGYEQDNRDLARTIREQTRRHNLTDLSNALGNRQIKLNLQTIQRRQAYISQLQKPMDWVNRGIAETAYIHSRFSVDLDLINVIKDYDLKGHMALAKEVLSRNEPTPENLTMAVDPTKYQSLDAIWDEIMYIGEGRGFDRTDPNFAIWQEICDGEFSGVAQLTQLSPTAAKCLSERNNPDLFLNNINILSIETAQQLSHWQGHWLCLNGLRAINPAAGRALLQWPGSRISLNGLKKLPTAVALYLPRWSGRHLELMGLDPQSTPDRAESFKYLHQWQQQGGRVYLPLEVENQYKAYVASLSPKPVKYGQGFYFETDKESN